MDTKSFGTSLGQSEPVAVDNSEHRSALLSVSKLIVPLLNMNYVLPGMGASSEMYSGAWKTLEGYSFLDWPNDFSGVSIRSLAKEIIDENSISVDDTLIGSSLGGIVGCEISNLINLKSVVLLGSAKNRNEVSSFLRMLSPLMNYTPLEFIQMLSGKIPMELSQMFSTSNAEFIRNMCASIFSWEGFLGNSPLFRVHGSKDFVIPCPKDVDVRISGGHLIAMTHSDECIEAIEGNQSL